MTRRSRWIAATCLAGAMLGSLAGCPDEMDDSAVLRGRWELILDNPPDDGQTFVEFDSDGRVDQVQVIYDSGRVTTNAFTSTVEVILGAVRITTRLVAGRLVFEGELSEDGNEIVGETTVVLSLPGTLIEIEGQPARLVRVD